MTLTHAGILFVRLWLCVLLALSATAVRSDAGDDTLHVYVQRGCPHCAQAKRFLDGVQAERPALRIVYHDVIADQVARDDLIALSQKAGIWPPAVPTFVLGERVTSGFDDAAALVAFIADTGRAPPPASITLPLVGELDAARLGLPLFTLALGLLDGFNPCAMWVLLFLLSLLVRLRDRRRMALIAGTFVLVSGAVYFAFMAAWLNLFLAVGLTPMVRGALAVLALFIGAVNVKDFFAFGRGLSLSIPESAKPGLYARMRRVVQAPSLALSLLSVAALALLVNLVELLCTAGLPALYTSVLAQHALDAAAHYGYLALYIAGYIADDALMVGTAVLALGSGKLTERGGRVLKLVSGAVMLALGLVMLFRPDWLV
ncbi:MAG: glutaredoxin family protein [Methyloversatilis sp.]|jgi:glutaredoxin|nr:glutaredoxin family protein [Methyloversatilis sp.]